jgi:hypothetical protein
VISVDVDVDVGDMDVGAWVPWTWVPWMRMPWTWVLGGGALLVVHSLMESDGRRKIIRSQQQRSSNEK